MSVSAGSAALSGLVDRILQDRERLGRPIVVGVSGFGGSGKSTLARELVSMIPGAIRMRGDDFLDPKRSHCRSTDWDGVERVRLVNEVLGPFRNHQVGTFRRYDWSKRALGAPEPVPSGEVMVVDLIGLFHPETLDHLDLTVWCDVDLETSSARGMHRDHELGRDHTALWEDVWIPNERDFFDRFAPRDLADVRLSSTR